MQLITIVLNYLANDNILPLCLLEKTAEGTSKFELKVCRKTCHNFLNMHQMYTINTQYLRDYDNENTY